MEESKEIKSYKFFKSKAMTKELFKGWFLGQYEFQNKGVYSVNQCDITNGDINGDGNFETYEEALAKYKSIEEVK